MIVDKESFLLEKKKQVPELMDLDLGFSISIP